MCAGVNAKSNHRKGHAGYKYYYGDVSKIPAAMQRVLDEPYKAPKNAKGE